MFLPLQSSQNPQNSSNFKTRHGMSWLKIQLKTMKKILASHGIPIPHGIPQRGPPRPGESGTAAAAASAGAARAARAARAPPRRLNSWRGGDRSPKGETTGTTGDFGGVEP